MNREQIAYMVGAIEQCLKKEKDTSKIIDTIERVVNKSDIAKKIGLEITQWNKHTVSVVSTYH